MADVGEHQGHKGSRIAPADRREQSEGRIRKVKRTGRLKGTHCRNLAGKGNRERKWELIGET